MTVTIHTAEYLPKQRSVSIFLINVLAVKGRM